MIENVEIGMKVRLSRLSEYYDQAPRKVGEVIYRDGYGDGYRGWWRVAFEDGYENAYRTVDLELVEEEPEIDVVLPELSKSDSQPLTIKSFNEFVEFLAPKKQSIYDVMPDVYGKKEHEMYMFNLKMEKVNRECGEYIRSMDKIRETVRKFTGPVRDDESVDER
jgi:hypothetical protein